MRRMYGVFLGLVAGLCVVGVAAAAPPDATDVPVDTESVPSTAPPPSTLPPAAGPLVVVPSGCAPAPEAHAVFLGTILLVDDPGTPTTFRFRVDTLLAGSLDGYSARDLVDVRFGEEAKFLDVGSQYIVGTAVDGETGLLVSTVREPTPLFGGDAVIGAEDSDVFCPRVDDPVRTLTVGGGSVDTGLLTPLDGEGPAMLRAVMLPIVVAFGVLLALVLLKHLLFGVGRSLRALGDSATPRVPSRRGGRRHLGELAPDGSPLRE